jgi:hypothetical protein
VLTGGLMDAEEAGWLRRMLGADGRIDGRGRKLVRELGQQAERVSPEFRQLYDECVTGSAGASS